MSDIDALWRRLEGDRAIFGEARGEAPAVVVNMVMSVDGATTIGGRVGRLTGPADQALLYRLRAESDAVLVGGATVLAEGYGHLLTADERARRRDLRGAPEPCLCVVTTNPAALADVPALLEAQSPLVWLTAAGAPLPPAARPVMTFASTDEGVAGRRLALRPLLRRLHDELGMGRIVCEGGPTLNAALLEEGLVAELFVAISPLLPTRSKR
jgi:riboflavin biosynthesis pyrimidine reductase